MPKRFLKRTVDWVKLGKRVPPDQKPQFLAFKAKSDAYWRRVQANPEEPPKIDWEAYQKAVPVECLVDEFKKEYEKFKVPYPQDKLSASIDKQWTAVQADIKQFIAKKEKNIKFCNEELRRIYELPDFEDMTMEMYACMYPNDAVDSVERPTYWPHTPDEQIGYEPPVIGEKAKKK